MRGVTALQPDHRGRVTAIRGSVGSMLVQRRDVLADVMFIMAR